MADDQALCPDDPRAIAPTTQAMLDALPTLAALVDALDGTAFHGEGLVAAGLLHMLAEIAEGDTVPGSREHAAARAFIDGDAQPEAERGPWWYLEAAMTETDVVLGERRLADAADLEMKVMGAQQ